MFDIIGDVHGCITELNLLLEKLGYNHNGYSNNRRLVFTGDLIDRGWYSLSVFLKVQEIVDSKCALLVRGNHDDKLMRWAKGNNVKFNHGFEKTSEEFSHIKDKVYKFLSSTPMYLSLDDGQLIIAHAAWKNSLKNIDPFDKKCRTWCLYGPTTGRMLENGLPDRIDWVIDRKEDSPLIVYGHQVYKEPRVLSNTYGIDTGCAFGGYLTALRYPELEFVSIKAQWIYDKSKPEISL